MVVERVEQVPAATTYPLRHQVLRPHLPARRAGLDSDDAAGAAHFAAYDENGSVISVASVFPEAPPWAGSDPPPGVGDRPAADSWRLRGMATTAAARGKGAGSAVLAVAMEWIRAAGGRLLWCNARLSAVAFYRRAGFAEWGAPWEEPDIGPHIVMFRPLDTGATGVRPPAGVG